MPLHVSPVSRRRFLAGTLATAAGCVTLRNGWGAEPRDSDHWALLADTHIAADPDFSARGANMADNLHRVGEQLIARAGTLQGAFINGDCAYNHGEVGDYQTLTRLLEPISAAGLPIHLTLGNHDHRDHFWSVLSDERAETEAVASKHVSVIESPRVNWFLLDSLHETNVTPGTLGPAQLKWLAAALDARADKPALVLAHHNPTPAANKDKPSLTDTDAFFEVLEPRRHVKAYLFGHTHRWQIAERDGIHLINLPPVAYLFDPTRPNGWVNAELRDAGMTLHLNALDTNHPDHDQVVRLDWRAG